MSDGNGKTPFDPSKHLRKVSGSDYLEIKWALVWFRDVHPDGMIETSLVEHEPGKYAVFQARVIAHVEGGSATGHGSETAGDFRDYLEKAETKAIGRALRALGFGTEFSPDFSESLGPQPKSVVNDQPVGDQRPGFERGTGNPDKWPETENERWVADAITPQQGKAIFAMSMKLGDMQEEELKKYLIAEFGVDDKNKLDKRQASATIKYLQAQLDNQPVPTP